MLTLCFRRLPGLVGDGLGDLPERGVDSWLPGVPFTGRTKGHRQGRVRAGSDKPASLRGEWLWGFLANTQTSLHLWSPEGAPESDLLGERAVGLTPCLM